MIAVDTALLALALAVAGNLAAVVWGAATLRTAVVHLEASTRSLDGAVAELGRTVARLDVRLVRVETALKIGPGYRED